MPPPPLEAWFIIIVQSVSMRQPILLIVGCYLVSVFNVIIEPHPDPLLKGEGERKSPFSLQEKGLGDEVLKAADKTKCCFHYFPTL